MKRNLLAIILVALIALAAWLVFSEKRSDSPAEPTATSSSATTTASITSTADDQSLTYTTVTKNETTAHDGTIGVSYPHFEGRGTVSADMNAIVESRIETITQEFKDNVSSITEDFPNIEYALGVRTTTTFLPGRNVATVLLDMYLNTGGAHPSRTFASLNFDTQTGDLIQLDDLFVRNSGYLDFLSAYSERALMANLGDFAIEDFISSGTAPDSQNFSVFVIEAGGVRFIFNEYQVAPYAAGYQEIEIPWSDLAPYLAARFRS